MDATRMSIGMAAGLGLVLFGSGPSGAQPPPPTAEQIAHAKTFKRLSGPETLNPGAWPQHFPYPDEEDSVVAAAEVHHLRYLDAKIRLVEVAYFPGIRGQMHGHPYPSVFANDAGFPKSTNADLDPERGPSIARGDAPVGAEWPTCMTMGPQAPHAESNFDTWPHHFYRLEYERVDGARLSHEWRAWYPHATEAPALRPSAPPTADGVIAAPDIYKLLYEDTHVRLVEVTLRPGATEPMHADPYPAVIALDSATDDAGLQDRSMDSASSMNGQDTRRGGAPPGFDAPRCATVGVRSPHALHNASATLIHFYRIEFKRIDGDGLKTRWREWYPWMANLKEEYDRHPYVLNY